MASGQLVNKGKSAIYMHHLVDIEVVKKVERITGIERQEFPFTYLGWPIFYARGRMDYYQGLITKIMDKLQSWKAFNPPNYVINKLHKIFSKFFWSSNVGGNTRHWASWNTLCMPYDEGGIAMEGLSLHQAITKCWTAQVLPRIKPIMQALPSCIVWELWKRRNSLKYGEAVSVSRVIYQNYTPKLKLEKVIWEFPLEGWIKVNNDGSCRGNPGRSSIGFCLRDEAGDLKYAIGREIIEGSNNEAEAMAIVEVLRLCKAMNYTQIWLQIDSMLLKNIIEKS
nr:uncharacterized protein LOC117274635 [Nicotiana tomentosiformis]